MMAYDAHTPSPAAAAAVVAATVPEPRVSDAALDNATLQRLLQMSQPQSGASLPDQTLALELLAQAGEDRGRALIQRLNLVEVLFNQWLSEPHLPPSSRELLEPIRFAVLKNAIVDVGVLTQPQHPLRQTLHNTLTGALTARTKGDEELRQAELRMRDLPLFVDLSASFVMPALPALQMLSDSQVRDLFRQLGEQSAERQRMLADAIAKTVHRELESLTFGLQLPSGVENFIRFGIQPLLCALMLRHGLRSVRWIAAFSRVQNLLTSYEPSRLAHSGDRSTIISTLALDLSGIGMPRDRIQRMISHLNAESA